MQDDLRSNDQQGHVDASGQGMNTDSLGTDRLNDARHDVQNDINQDARPIAPDMTMDLGPAPLSVERDVRSTPERIWDSLIGAASRWDTSIPIPNQQPTQAFQPFSGEMSIPNTSEQQLSSSSHVATELRPSNDQLWANWIVPSVPTSPRTLYPNPELPIDTFNLDMSSNPSMRNFFGGAADGTDVQVQLLLNGYNSASSSENPFWPFDMPSNESLGASMGENGVEGGQVVPNGSRGQKRPGQAGRNGVMHIKYLRTHGRTAYVPGKYSSSTIKIDD